MAFALRFALAVVLGGEGPVLTSGVWQWVATAVDDQGRRRRVGGVVVCVH